MSKSNVQRIAMNGFAAVVCSAIGFASASIGKPTLSWLMFLAAFVNLVLVFIFLWPEDDR